MAVHPAFAERLQSTAPVAGDIGGLLFFAYWMNRSRGLGIPPLLTVLLDLTTLVLVGASVVGYQLAQGTAEQAWIGWAAAAAMGLGFTGSPALLCAGIVLFGVAIVRCGVHPRLPGYLLMAGGAVLLVAEALAAGFGRPYGSPSPASGAVTGIALLAIAGALADLDALRRQAASEALLERSGDGSARPR